MKEFLRRLEILKDLIQRCNREVHFSEIEREILTSIAEEIRVILTKSNELNQLKESEALYRNFVENFQGIGFQGYNDFSVDFFHGPVYEITGYSAEDFYLGKVKWDDLIIPEDLSWIHKQILEFHSGSNEKSSREYRIINKKGEIRWILEYNQKFRNKNNNKEGVRGILLDITAKKEVEQKLKESEQKYREAYDTEMIYRDIFVHDFNNILQNIRSATELSELYLVSPSFQDKIKEMNNIIKEQIVRSTILIKTVRRLSQVEEFQIDYGHIELNRVLNASIEYVKKSFQSKVIKIEKKSLIGEINVYANELLSDVFDNILINAVKYCDKSNCEILIKISRCQGDNKQYAKIEVIDNGVGIPDEIKPLIFQIGFNKEKRSKGMGFGLSIAKKILDRFNGKITVEDRVKGDRSRGSDFIVLLVERE